MRKLTALAAVLGLMGAVSAPAAADPSASDSRARGKARLTAFNSCSGLVRYARRHAPQPDTFRGPTPAPPPPSGGGGGGGEGPQEDNQALPAPAPTSGDDPSSQTNVQEEGIDEPDIVKSDGRRIFAALNGVLHAVDARAAEPRLLGTLELSGYTHDLLLHGDRLLVISQTDGDLAESATSIAPYRSVTLLSEVDVSDPERMRVLRTMTIDGHHVSSRQNGRSIRVVVSSPPLALETGEDPDQTRLFDWLPTATFKSRVSGREARRALVRCGSVRRPRVFSGLDTLTVLTIDLEKGLPAVDSDALMTDGQTVYASADSLYVATERWFGDDALSEPAPPRSGTAIHKFDVSKPHDTTYRASGGVRGYLLSQWSLSEHKGVLRVATTDLPSWWGGAPDGESESFVTTMDERTGLLAPRGRVGGLGRGERIFAVRFIEDVGYVVTFRQTDPLYTVDLADPRDPKVLGELKIRGFSAYLHPVGDDLLLGVGQDATEQGRRLGTQLSLFDVSDLSKPTRLHAAQLGSGSSSEIEYDHHAFLWWAPAKLAVIPVEEYSSEPFAGAVGFRVDRAGGIAEAGRVTHETASYPSAVRRSVVVGGRLFTVSEQGVETGDLDTLGQQAWLEFPSAPDASGGPAPQPARTGR